MSHYGKKNNLVGIPLTD